MCGGGAKSALWCKIMANILGLRIHLLKSEEGPAMGAAMLAMTAAGEYPSVKAAAGAIVKIDRTIIPQADIVERYEEKYQQFRQIYPALKPVFQRFI